MSSGTTWKEMPLEQPRVCAGCDKPIRMKDGALWFKTSPPQLSWHFHCRGKQWA